MWPDQDGGTPATPPRPAQDVVAIDRQRPEPSSYPVHPAGAESGGCEPAGGKARDVGPVFEGALAASASTWHDGAVGLGRFANRDGETEVRRRLVHAALIAGGLLAACSAPYHVDANDMEEGTFERWGCGDHFDGCRFGGCAVKLTGDFNASTGTVEVAGTVNAALFRLVGLQRRWDWGDDDGRYPFALTLDADGTAQYYNFSIVMPDADGVHRTTPADLFKCHRLRK